MTITAKVVADSMTEDGKRITTFELEYPRFIHAEFMTHRLFSRNAASSRAIPVATLVAMTRDTPAEPVYWGKNQPGMSAKEELSGVLRDDAIELWKLFAGQSAAASERLMNLGVHKQIANRIMEPFSHIKVVCTATEYDNFFYLRCHPDAQPEIQELAKLMYEAREDSTITVLKPGEWHLPYFRDGYWAPSTSENAYKEYVETDPRHVGHTLADAIAISASCCAQVSYRKLDDSLEKARTIYNRLVESKPVHASPFEHQATPMLEPHFREDEQVLLYLLENTGTDEGITHYDRHGNAWSGNFKGWVQNRQLIEGNVCNKYLG